IMTRARAKHPRAPAEAWLVLRCGPLRGAASRHTKGARAMSTSKTEEPTPRRLREARRRGEVPKSRELVAAVSLFAGLAALALTAPALTSSFRPFLEWVLQAEPASALRSVLSLAPPL